MKNMKIRSAILYMTILAFFLGMGAFVYELINKSEKWVFSSVNRHLSQGTSSQGKILDRNGLVLASTSGGKRIYNENVDIRKGVLHAVGDGSILIPGSVQKEYASELFGYNPITGLGAPELIKMSKNITLNLDAEICGNVSKNFKDRKGTAIAYNYLTGEVLCMVSLPTYDVENRPNFKTDDSEKYDGVYLNRAIYGSYTPGSVFKIFTAAAALELMEKAESRNFICDKVKVLDGGKVTCMKKHGKINLKDGICKSCDIVFSDIALELGKEKMTQKMKEYGFNQQLYFEKSPLAKSVYSVENASECDLGWSGVGQYTNTLNPMHMLQVMGCIANDGVGVKPRIVKSMGFDGEKDVQCTSVETQQFMNPTISQKLKEMMRYTVKNQYGDKMFSPAVMCAKTGTAEVGEGKLPHGWIVGFSYDKSFPIAFVVVVENGDFGIKSAGPIASSMIKQIYSRFKT